MAEGLLRAMYVDRYEAYSAGVEASQVDTRAVKVMNEIGIDISKQRSKMLMIIGELFSIRPSRYVIRPGRCVLSAA